MKQYRDIAIIVESYDSGKFLNKLNATISKMQKQGYAVDIQYAPTSSQLTALVLSYKEE